MVFLLPGFTDDHIDESAGSIWFYCRCLGSNSYPGFCVVSVCCLQNNSMIRILVCFFGILMAPALSAESRSMSDKLMQVKSFTADNGLHVIFHHRDDSDTFTAQLVVNLGLQDFSCKDRQAPHLLEHMLLEGTTRFDRKTLRQRIRNLGGKTKAYTREESTYYTISLHSDYPDIALDTLHSVISEPRFNKQDFITSKQIIHAEQGSNSNSTSPFGKPIPVLTEMAKAQLFKGTELYCDNLSSPDHLRLDYIKALYRDHYVASNMTLIVIGHFDEQAILELIGSRFMALPMLPEPKHNPIPRWQPDYATINARNALFNPEANLHLYLPGVGSTDPLADYYEIIAEYFSEQLYYEVRGAKGLGYTPRAHLDNTTRYGYIEATTKTTSRWLPEAQQSFVDLYQQLQKKGIPEKDVERIKAKLVLEFESKQRDHDELASIYRRNRFQIRETGKMPDFVANIKQVNAGKLNQVIATRFPPNPLIATHVRPSLYLTVLQFVLISMVVTAMIWPLLRRLRKRNQS
ncbi:MAG: insulinase family protein [Ketobacter sp.]|nr:MAG: insulinase family protein [Ketobacter sp.]